MLSIYQGRMIASSSAVRACSRAAAAVALLMLGAGLSGCADMNDTMLSAFADPAKYDLYDCKQLKTEREALANRGAELQGLMAKADTGAAGPVVAELAYRNDYIAVRGQSKLAEEAWRRNKCTTPAAGTPPAAAAAPPVAAAPPPGKRGPQPLRSGNAVY
jgi:hypothetical protein